MVRLPFSFAGSSNDPARQKEARESAKENAIPRDFKNYYHVLGIPNHASLQQIEKAYGEMLQKFGPHVSISECDPMTQINMMKQINEAYHALINPAQRKAHDATLATYFGKEDVRTLRKKIVGEQSPDEQ